MTWTAVIKHDGEEVVEAPVDDWLAASVLAEVIVAMFGGPVSVVNAVVAARPKHPEQLGLLDDEPLSEDEWVAFAEAAGFEP